MQQPPGSGPLAPIQVFLAELKRRQVFRVAAVYGATAFIILQVADLLFPRLALPDWTVTLTVGLALLGFPLALALAWVFEPGPEGMRRTEPAGMTQLREIVSEPRARRWPVGIAAILGVALLVGGAWWTLDPAAGGQGVYDSIAVLPFSNLSGQQDDEYFGDGLAEELLNALSGIPGLRVAARTSAFALKGASIDVRTIGDTLNVATVLAGSVRRSRDHVRISVQLADARSGYQLWSQTYDRPLTDLFAVQDAIAREIVNALSVQLAPAAEEQLYRGGTDDVVAYDLFLLGRQKWATRQVPLLRESAQHFEQAIARDSSFALAWSGLADALDALAWRAPDALPRVPDARRAAQRALLLEPELAEAWASLGVLYSDYDRDWRFGELALRRAIELKPSYAPAHSWLSDLLARAGKREEAAAASERAVELDPLAGIGVMIHAQALLALRHWPEARAAYARLSDMDWQDAGSAATIVAHARWLGISDEEAQEKAEEWARILGYRRPEEARVIGRAIFEPELSGQAVATLEAVTSSSVTGHETAQLALALGDREYALKVLERMRDERSPRIVNIPRYPIFDQLRDDPRFRRVMEPPAYD